MAIRTVRLDSDAEQVLAEIQAQTGQSVSEILRCGIQAYRTEMQQKASKTAYEIYRDLDLSSGKYAVAPASRSKEAIKGIIQEKHHR